MKFRKHVEPQIDSKEIFNKVSKCKPEELENLLKHIETIIEKSKDKNVDLLMAKTITTSRIASMKSK